MTLKRISLITSPYCKYCHLLKGGEFCTNRDTRSMIELFLGMNPLGWLIIFEPQLLRSLWNQTALASASIVPPLKVYSHLIAQYFHVTQDNKEQTIIAETMIAQVRHGSILERQWPDGYINLLLYCWRLGKSWVVVLKLLRYISSD